MALNVSNLTSTIQAPVNFVLMRGLLSAAKKVCPYFNETLPGSLEKRQGSASVKWRRIENLDPVTANLSEHTENGPLAFGVGRSTVKPTITDITKAVGKTGNAILTTEEVDLFNVNSNTMALMDTLGGNAGESLNLFAATEFGNTTTSRFASGAANKSAVVAEMKASDIKYAVNQLNRNSAMRVFTQGTGSSNYNSQPIRASYMGICHSDVEEDVRDLTGFIGVEQYGGYTSTFTGEFGTVNGVRWCSTEIAPIETGAGTTSTSDIFRGTSVDTNDLYSSYVYGREAVGTIGLGERQTKEIYMMGNKLPTVELIVHQPGSSGVGDMFNEIGSIAWKAWHATKVLNSNWLVKVVTLAKNLS